MKLPLPHGAMAEQALGWTGFLPPEALPEPPLTHGGSSQLPPPWR